MNNQQLACFGERIAQKYLQEKGYCFIEANFRCRYGELDLVFLDSKKERLVVAEVKTRYVNTRVSPKESLTERKLYQLEKTTLFYNKKNKNRFPEALRIDVIAILVNLDGTVQKIEHIQNITQ